MLDMCEYESEQPSFITDLKLEDDKIIVTYADGHTTEEPYTLHNFNLYRDRLVDQATNFTERTINSCGVDWIKEQAKRVAGLILGITGLYFLYNLDIHIIMKILITVLVIAGEAVLFFYTHLYLNALEDDSLEAFAYQEYLKHLDNFRYYNKETGTNEYLVPIEEVSERQMTQKFVKKLSLTIDEMKSKGSRLEDMHINYSQINPDPSPKM